MSGSAEAKALAAEQMVHRILVDLPDALAEDYVDLAAAYPGSGERPKEFAPWLEALRFGAGVREGAASEPPAAVAEPAAPAAPADARGGPEGEYAAALEALGLPHNVFPVCVKLLRHFETDRGLTRERALDILSGLCGFVDSLPVGDLDTVVSYLTRRKGG